MDMFAKDLQQLLSETVGSGVGVYEREAPRDSGGAVLYDNMPFVVYQAYTQSPAVENGVFSVDLFLDIWALNGWAGCFDQGKLLDAALDGTVYDLPGGVFCCDRNGQIMGRSERDPNDERIRRMQSQYLIRYYPNAVE